MIEIFTVTFTLTLLFSSFFNEKLIPAIRSYSSLLPIPRSLPLQLSHLRSGVTAAIRAKRISVSKVKRSYQFPLCITKNKPNRF